MNFGISNYQSIKSLIGNINESQRSELKKILEDIERRQSRADARFRKIQEGSRSIGEAARSTIKMNELSPIEEFDERARLVASALGGNSNFIHVYANLSNGIQLAWKMLNDIAVSLGNDSLILPEDISGTTREKMHDLSAEYQLNRQVCESFSSACLKLSDFRYQLVDFAGQIVGVMDKYCQALSERHSSGGMKIWHGPILTDFAISIYDNISHHGDVFNNDCNSEISSYSLRRAEAIIEWIKDEEIKVILMDEMNGLTESLAGEIWSLWKIASRLEAAFSSTLKSVASIHYKRYTPASEKYIDSQISMLEDANPNRVKYRDFSSGLSEEERRNLQFRNESIEKICQMLKNDTPSHEVSKFVWEEVKKLKKYFLEVNSFYVCRIAQGNPFSGKSSGQLEVIPGKKPLANFDDIIGSGFDDVRRFVKHIAMLRKWEPLYLITSPRKSADKANILLIGPMGCGKTECMRAICNEEECIAIFASGSDFLTAWMGEAQKNPKRLFESAVKLQKESGLPVHILIDEIDSVLNNDRSTTTINLSLEFQMIMDGVVEYPNIYVWGATNNPERIPMPMIRRFSEVLIVGKLDQDHRVELFKHFLSSMPLSERFTDDVWKSFAERLEGATGDIIRKICEHAWRIEISKFIESFPEEAERMLKVLSMLSYDLSTGLKNDKLEARRADSEIDETNLGGRKTSRRKKFLNELKNVFELQPERISLSIDAALENIGIINEMDTAIRTYEDAEKLLAVMKDNRIKKGERDNGC